MFRFRRLCIIFTLLIMTISALICGLAALDKGLTLAQYLKYTLLLDAAAIFFIGAGFLFCIAVGWAFEGEEHIGFLLYTKKHLTRKFK